MFHVRRQHADRAEDAWKHWHNNLPNTQQARDVSRMGWPATAESHQFHQPRVAAALNRDRADRPGHVEIGHLAYAMCGLSKPEPERFGDMHSDRLGGPPQQDGL